MKDRRDPELSRFLASWRGRAVPDDFNAGVWNAVAGGSGPQVARPRWLQGLWVTPDAGPSPLAVAASLMLAVGVGAAVAAATPPVPAAYGHYEIHGPDTVTGAYARMLLGGRR